MWSGAPQGLVAQDKETLVKLLAGDEVDEITLMEDKKRRIRKRCLCSVSATRKSSH